MPDQSSASTEHALMQEITAPLATLPDDPVPAVADVEFPTALRGYDRLAVDAYVQKTSQLVAELQATRSPDAAIRRALERVGEEVSGILQRAHETAAQITSQSRSEAEDRLETARQEAAQIVSPPRSGCASSTPRPTGSGPSAIGSSRTRASWPGAVALTDSAADRFPAEAAPAEARRDRGPGVGRGDRGGEPEDIFAEEDAPFVGEDESFAEEEDEEPLRKRGGLGGR